MRRREGGKQRSEEEGKERSEKEGKEREGLQNPGVADMWLGIEPKARRVFRSLLPEPSLPREIFTNVFQPAEFCAFLLSRH